MKTCWSSESLKTSVWAYLPITIEWPEIALRLVLTVVAGTLIGFNRSEHGHPVGLRTTLLVCLAASVSMIQINRLLPIAGKKPDSFAVLDFMRLPLGILSGMGGPKRLESRWKQDRHVTLSLTVDASGPTEDELTTRLQAIRPSTCLKGFAGTLGTKLQHLVPDSMESP